MVHSVINIIFWAPLPNSFSAGLQLVNYTTNATVQSQAQMNQVVDTFASLMGSVVGDFRNLSSGYSDQLRGSLAAARAPMAPATLPLSWASPPKMKLFGV